MNLLLFSLLASFWGGSFVAIKASLESFPPLFSASLRVLTALAAISIIYKLMKINTKIPSKDKVLCYTLGFFSISLPFSLLFWGEQYVEAGIAGVINGTTPIWTFLSAYFVFQTEKNSVKTTLSGIFTSFLGIYLIFSPKIEFGTSSQEIYGIVAIFGMAISYGIGGNLAKKIMSNPEVTPRKAIYHQHVSAAIILLVASFSLEWEQIINVKEIPLKASLSLVYLGVCSTAIAYIILFHLVNKWGTIKAMSVTYLIPVMALIFDYILYGNVLLPIQFAGVAVVSLGLLILQRPVNPLKSLKFRP
ncbi:MAG: DMT family transporter [Bdellovibrionota bacterium]|nr:DMT family transporter [Bdellovibrionota bacterium]